jgi:hypothetical protein
MTPAAHPQFAVGQPPATHQAPSPPAPRKPNELEMDRLADDVMKRIERHVRKVRRQT